MPCQPWDSASAVTPPGGIGPFLEGWNQETATWTSAAAHAHTSTRGPCQYTPPVRPSALEAAIPAIYIRGDPINPKHLRRRHDSEEPRSMLAIALAPTFSRGLIRPPTRGVIPRSTASPIRSTPATAFRPIPSADTTPTLLYILVPALQSENPPLGPSPTTHAPSRPVPPLLPQARLLLLASCRQALARVALQIQIPHPSALRTRRPPPVPLAALAFVPLRGCAFYAYAYARAALHSYRAPQDGGIPRWGFVRGGRGQEGRRRQRRTGVLMAGDVEGDEGEERTRRRCISIVIPGLQPTQPKCDRHTRREIVLVAVHAFDLPPPSRALHPPLYSSNLASSNETIFVERCGL
ncbi:hypothetical protein DFH09DRAFT_1374883 [Mycena vulgaris]|nr:hypothetical protein DFH09DRAFT_1374883 [Mycena vulgaris]